MTAGQGRPDFEARLHSDVRSTNLSYQTICLTYGILLSTSEEQVSGVDAVNRLASAHREYSPTSASPLQTPPDLAPPCRSPAACVFLASARSYERACIAQSKWFSCSPHFETRADRSLSNRVCGFVLDAPFQPSLCVIFHCISELFPRTFLEPSPPLVRSLLHTTSLTQPCCFGVIKFPNLPILENCSIGRIWLWQGSEECVKKQRQHVDVAPSVGKLVKVFEGEYDARLQVELLKPLMKLHGKCRM